MSVSYDRDIFKESEGKQMSAKKNIFMIIAFGLVACILYGIGAGLRCDIGILVSPLAEHCGINYDDVSMCVAVMQLLFGASQPFFGIIASRKSNRFVLMMGIAFMGMSMVGMILSNSYAGLLFSLGILFGLGAGAISFGLVLASAIHFVGQENAMIISGMLNAAAGMIGFILSPFLQAVLTANGLIVTLGVMFVIVVLLIPVLVFVTSRDSAEETMESDESRSESGGTVYSLLRKAFGNRTFRLLFAGFSTCGFHMIIIESHLFSQFVLFGIDETRASWAFSAYGIATIIGALLSGFLSTRLRKGRLLSFYYGFRAVWVLAYVWFMPKNMVTAVLFSIGLGMTGDATVSPTSGLVSENFSVSKVATLIGILFFTHQIGAFFSAWLGGVLRQALGGYTAIWMLDVVLCVFACIMSLRIKSGNKGRE
jgi:predicted MFS family arabinose efflux permease